MFIINLSLQIFIALTVSNIFKGSKWCQYPTFWIFISSQMLIGFFLIKILYEITCLCFPNRFDLSLLGSEIIWVKGVQKGPTPKISLDLCAVFCIEFLWRISFWKVSSQICCSFDFFREMRGSKVFLMG